MMGITTSIVLTLMQNFECKASIEDTSGGGDIQDFSDDSLRTLQGPFEPILPGVFTGKTKPRLVFAAEPYWAPYVFVNPHTGLIEGLTVDMVGGMGKLCDFDFALSETLWTECWSDEEVGRGLLNGDFHACMAYAHTRGARDRQMDFSHAFLRDNSKSTGLLVRLNEDGTPEIDGYHDLAGKKIVHINGWAPTKDGMGFVVNSCTGEGFLNYTMVPSSLELPNDDALSKLLDGTVDAMWVFVDQDENYKNAGCVQKNPNKTSMFPEWDCAKWAGFGKKFAFIHTGMAGHAINGTSLAVFKKGSGLNEMINPCMDRYMHTKEYYEVCAKHGLAAECYPNAFFPTEYFASVTPVWDIPTKDLPTTCASGYCPCPS
eukprot:CAMPEP_0114250272 /NCGR_PEP_ID=MMETSP0058-20121206/14607_1 /TAXON_ID=36894 /ORGANISM="Pyramimonas parkeae, CCMP726" /LENGTH=372 /DNA_ID=CAMNT_0001363913 /DNA_START=232 /DNA_END=1350 /DNA_ORIENTATION=-